MFDELRNRIRNGLEYFSQKKSKVTSSGTSNEKIVVTLVSIILAFCLWAVVNLNRSYTITVDVPIVLGNVSTDQALAEQLPKYVTASVSGEGWSLLKMYQDPPPVYIEVSEEQVNLFEQVRRQVDAVSNITVQKVNPLYLRLHLEDKVTKKVPIISNVKVDFAPQYGFVAEPQFQPDSIIVAGARSVIEDITHWPTDSLQLNKINSSVSRQVSLEEPGSLVSLSEQQVTFKVEVAQFTEGQVTVPVTLQNFPFNSNISFSPSTVEITYLIPVKEYTNFKERSLFAAYVTYAQLQQDTTGFVTPHIEQLADEAHPKVQQVQPPQVAYFNVIEN